MMSKRCAQSIPVRWINLSALGIVQAWIPTTETVM